MKRNLIYVLSLMLIAGGFCACKRTVSVSEENSKTTVYKDGTVVTKSYSVKPGGNAQEISNPQELSERTAKRLLREKLQKTNSERLVAPVRIGYYECNDFGERMTLLKLAANKIINLKCDEIVTEQGSTYWVTVDLTWRGRWLKESPAKPEFPEDRITEEEAVARLFPVVDQDPWGVPTTDNNVPAEITEAIKAFYRGLQAGRNYNQSMMDADIICAMSLIDKLASYGVNKLDADPFTRGTQLTPELVDHIRVLRMPRLENAYLVSVGEHDFLYVISKDANARVMIEDLAYLAPSELQSIDQTVCSLGGTITKEEIDDAREAKRMSDEWEAKLKELEDKYKQVEAAITEGEDAVICKTSGALRFVEHSEPTCYEIAKSKEHFEEVMLLGAILKVSDIDEIEVSGDQKRSNATAVATYEKSKVNAVGRILLGLKDGTKQDQTVSFNFTKRDGWKVAE